MCSAPKHGDLIEGRFRVVGQDDEAIYAVDVDDGAAVLVRHAAWGNHGEEFVDRTLTETAARVVASLAHPSIARVRMSAPRVVIDAPPENSVLRPDAEDMAACALLALDAIATLHAAGVPGVALDPCNARFCKRDGRWSLTLVHPPLASKRVYGTGSVLLSSTAPESVLVNDLTSIASLLDRHNNDAVATPGFLSHLVGRSPVEVVDEHPMARRFRVPKPPPHVPITHEGLEAIHAMLRSASPSPGSDGTAGPIARTFPRSARELAEAILPFAPRDGGWSDLVAAMPHITKVTLARDWDAMIARGEEARAAHPRRARDGRVDETQARADDAVDDDNFYPAHHRYVACPLAAAYHARACAAFARGDREDARTDVDRAIAVDRSVAHLTTRGVLLACEGDALRARAAYDEALAIAERTERRRWRYRAFIASLARAHYCRGCLRIETGDPRGALDDFDHARQRLEEMADAWVSARDGGASIGLAPPRDWIERARAAALRRLSLA